MILYNKIQKECIEHPPSPLMIIAGAGTGKTTTIVGRIAHLIKTHNIEPIGQSCFNWLGVPLKLANGKTIGMICVQNYTDDYIFSEEVAYVKICDIEKRFNIFGS